MKRGGKYVKKLAGALRPKTEEPQKDFEIFWILPLLGRFFGFQEDQVRWSWLRNAVRGGQRGAEAWVFDFFTFY